MKNNDVIKSIRYTLDVNDVKIAEILKLAGYDVSREEIASIFSEDEESTDSGDELMAHFLDGLIYFKRGKSKDHPPQPIQIPVTNNQVLKKLRVAFKLREEEMHETLEAAGFSISKPELSALFRSEDHKNYRECGDQILRYFLKGLAIRYKK